MSSPREEAERAKLESKELYNALARHSSSYTTDDRISAAMAYVTEGNLKAVERVTNISYNTLKLWKDLEWWPIALDFCHRRKDKELEGKLTRIINDSVNEISDRVRNGDWSVQKDGNKVRVPMKARDLAVITNLIYDKRAMLRGESPALLQKTSQEDKLKQLENKFNEFSAQLKAKTIEGEVVHER